MQQGCRECGIEGPSSNFGHQGVFFSDIFTSRVRFLPKLSPRGVFFPKFSPQGVFLNFLNLTNFEFFGKLKNFGRHRGVYVDLKLDFAKKYQNFG